MASIVHREKEDQNIWNFLFSLFFLAALVGAVWVVGAVRGSFPTSIPIFDAVLMAFASLRITRLIVYDKITRFFREWFVEKREISRDGKKTMVELVPFTYGIRHTIHDLLGCPWCIGIWSGLIITFFYFMFPWAWMIILFLAVAGAGSALQIGMNMVGWKAENLKLDALAKVPTE